jgi:hypothetical protein
MAHGKLGYGADPIHVTIRGLVLVPAMMMMQRFDVVALLLQQEQKDAFGWIGQKQKRVNPDEARWMMAECERPPGSRARTAHDGKSGGWWMTMILIRNCSCRCVCTTNFGRCGTVPIVLPNKTIVHFSVILVAAAKGRAGRQFLLDPFVLVFLAPCVVFLSKLGIALEDRRHRMSPSSEGSGKLYMCSNCPRRYGIIGYASTNRLASCVHIVVVAFWVKESAVGTTIITTSNNEQIHPSILACCHASQHASFLCRKSRRRRLVAISLPFVPMAPTDSSTTSAFAKATSAAPAGRLDKNTRSLSMNQNQLGIVWIQTMSSNSASHKPPSGLCRSAGILARVAQYLLINSSLRGSKFICL